MDESKDSLNSYDLGAPLPALAAGLSPEDRAGLVSALKNKRQSLARMRKGIKRLRAIQSQYYELEAKFFKERAALEAKYQKFYEPLYTERFKIVNGVVEVESVAKENAVETKNKGLPGFWLNVMKANEVLTPKIKKQDEEALMFLKDIKWSRISDPEGFKLEFFFNSNPYFKNSVLTKTFHMINVFEPFPVNMMGTEIEWYPGNCSTHKILTKQPMKRSKNAAKPITETVYYWSFFNFFSTLPTQDIGIGGRLDQDYIIGAIFRDQIIPHAVSWFSLEDAQDDDFQDLVGDDGDEEDEDEEEEDDDDDTDNERVDSWSRSPSPESASSSEFYGGRNQLIGDSEQIE